MSHYQRDEEGWQKFNFNWPYAEGLRRLREKVLAREDFDPAVLWIWGTMQARAVVRILDECEARLGEMGQAAVARALVEVGKEIGSQIIEGVEIPADLSQAELASFCATVINCIVYASLERPRIESEDRVSFEILWCPHQDVYSAFDCRVQRYLVQGMLEALKERGLLGDWQVRFTSTIPAGAPTCRFELYRASREDLSDWEEYTQSLERKALEIAASKGREKPEGAK
ncbi:MAG: hypothetical protein WHT46_05405 [Candidatus Geothermincolales bacterium]